VSSSRLGPRPSAGVSSLVAPVEPHGLDAVRGQDFARVEGHDGDLLLLDDGQDAATAMGGPDAEVMEAAGPAQGHRAGLVDEVGAQPEVARRAAPGGMGLRRGPVGLARGATADGPVRSLLVVGEAEGIELGLQLRQGPRWRLLPEPALQGLLEALDLALGLGMTGCSVLLPDAEPGEQVLEGVVPAGEARGVDGAVESPMDVKSSRRC